MNELNIAAQIYALAKEKANAEVFLLEVLKLTKHADISKVLEYYQQLLENQLTLVTVTSSLELSKDQKNVIKSKLDIKLAPQKLAFSYQVKQGYTKAIEIRVGDDLIEFSFS